MKRLEHINGIKIVALLMIFWWHSSIPSPQMDLGARACEIFFIISGFLFFYSYKNRPIPPTIKDSILYGQRKLIVFFPVHICALLIRGMLNYFQTSEVDVFKGVLNALLLQSWSNDASMYFSYNGATWFLSSLIFCVFMSPFLARMIRNSQKKYVYFPLVLGMEFLVCYNVGNICGMFNIFHYISPLVRLLEYFLGMMLADFYFDVLKYRKMDNKLIMSWIEIFAIIIYVYLSGAKSGDQWNRAYFVALCCPLLFVFSFGSGVISKILSNRLFQFFSIIQFEFYLFHSSCIIFAGKYIPNTNSYFLAAISFVLTIIVCIVYRKILKQRCEGIMKNVFEKINTWVLE